MFAIFYAIFYLIALYFYLIITDYFKLFSAIYSTKCVSQDREKDRRISKCIQTAEGEN